jgi:hypothetical protein
VTQALAELQRRFIAALDDERDASWPGVEVYRTTARANAGAALAQTYPVVRRLVGDPFFFEAARTYGLANPSASGDLNEYGARFAEFLRGYEHAVPLGYLPGVARLEWACHESARAADASGLDFEALARAPATEFSRMRFSLHPALRLVRSHHPIASIWHANQLGRDGTPDATHGAQFVVVARGAEGVQVETVQPSEWQLLMSLAKGATLGEASAGLDAATAARVIGTSLARFIREGAIAGFALSTQA